MMQNRFQVLVTLCMPLTVVGLLVHAPTKICADPFGAPSKAALVGARQNPLQCLRENIDNASHAIMLNYGKEGWVGPRFMDAAEKAYRRLQLTLEGDDPQAKKMIDTLWVTRDLLGNFTLYPSLAKFQSDLEKTFAHFKMTPEFLMAGDVDDDGQVNQTELRGYLISLFAIIDSSPGGVVVPEDFTLQQLLQFPSADMMAWINRMCDADPTEATLAALRQDPLPCLRENLVQSAKVMSFFFQRGDLDRRFQDTFVKTITRLNSLIYPNVQKFGAPLLKDPETPGRDAQAMKVLDMVRATSEKLERFPAYRATYASLAEFQSDLEKEIADLKLTSEFLKAVDIDDDGQVSQTELRCYLLSVLAINGSPARVATIPGDLTAERLKLWSGTGMMTWVNNVE